MTNIVHKEKLTQTTLQLDVDRFLHVDMQDDLPRVWYIPGEQRYDVFVVGTGVTDGRIEQSQHIGTFLMDGFLVWHVFATRRDAAHRIERLIAERDAYKAGMDMMERIARSGLRG